MAEIWELVGLGTSVNSSSLLIAPPGVRPHDLFQGDLAQLFEGERGVKLGPNPIWDD